MSSDADYVGIDSVQGGKDVCRNDEEYERSQVGIDLLLPIAKDTK